MIHNDDSNDSESGTVRLVRTTCKAVHRRGCAKSGFHVTFRKFLRDKGIDSIPLAVFKGNRFNIIFLTMVEYFTYMSICESSLQKLCKL